MAMSTYFHSVDQIINFNFSGALGHACGAPWVSKSTHSRNILKSLDRTPTERTTVRPHHRATNVYSHTF